MSAEKNEYPTMVYCYYVKPLGIRGWYHAWIGTDLQYHDKLMDSPLVPNSKAVMSKSTTRIKASITAPHEYRIEWCP